MWGTHLMLAFTQVARGAAATLTRYILVCSKLAAFLFRSFFTCPNHGRGVTHNFAVQFIFVVYMKHFIHVRLHTGFSRTHVRKSAHRIATGYMFSAVWPNEDLEVVAADFYLLLCDRVSIIYPVLSRYQAPTSRGNALRHLCLFCCSRAAIAPRLDEGLLF